MDYWNSGEYFSFLFFSLYQITDLHARHKRTLFCRELPLVPLSCPQGLKKETFEELLKKAGIPCQYFCCRSFATWDVLLPTEEQATKAAASNMITKHFRLQPEYKGTRRIYVTVCKVPVYITGEVLALYLSVFGKVEEINLLRSPVGTAYGNYTFQLCLMRDGFKAIPKTLASGDWQMMVEGRHPRCWRCKQIGHVAKFCP